MQPRLASASHNFETDADYKASLSIRICIGVCRRKDMFENSVIAGYISSTGSCNGNTVPTGYGLPRQGEAQHLGCSWMVMHGPEIRHH